MEQNNTPKEGHPGLQKMLQNTRQQGASRGAIKGQAGGNQAQNGGNHEFRGVVFPREVGAIKPTFPRIIILIRAEETPFFGILDFYD